MNYTYILECNDGSYYTGWTTDLQARFQKHCEGLGAKYTKSHPPLRIAYYEVYEDKKEALKREREIKKLNHKEKADLIAKSSQIHHNRINEEAIQMKILRCNKCKKMFVMVHEHGCPTICCGEPMEELTANTTDGAAEKHVPVVTVEGNKVIVNVGDVDHPMLEAHYIEFIAVETESGFQLKYLQPGEKPHAEFLSEEPVKAAYEFCNLHGLWKTEL